MFDRPYLFDFLARREIKKNINLDTFLYIRTNLQKRRRKEVAKQ